MPRFVGGVGLGFSGKAAKASLDCPAAGLCVPAIADWMNSRQVSAGSMAIGHVALVSGFAKIAPPVVSRVSILVVNLLRWLLTCLK